MRLKVIQKSFRNLIVENTKVVDGADDEDDDLVKKGQVNLNAVGVVADEISLKTS